MDNQSQTTKPSFLKSFLQSTSRSYRICALILAVLLVITVGIDLFFLSFPPGDPTISIWKEAFVASWKARKSDPEANAQWREAALAEYQAGRDAMEAEAAVIPVSSIGSEDDLLDSVYLHLLLSLPGNGGKRSYSSQGSCTDGTTVWIAWSNPLALSRTNLISGETFLLDYSDKTWLFGHANDMTYNPNTDRIYITAYDTERPLSMGNIAVVDPVTLELERIVSLKKGEEIVHAMSIAYDRLSDQYIIATRDSDGRTFMFFDSYFRYVREFSADRIEYFGLQGIETDGKYIYRSLWDSAGENYITVCDLYGHYVKLITVPLSGEDYELEDIMYDWQGNWYLNIKNRTKPRRGEVSYLGIETDIDYAQVDMFLRLLERAFRSPV